MSTLYNEGLMLCSKASEKKGEARYVIMSKSGHKFLLPALTRIRGLCRKYLNVELDCSRSSFSRSGSFHFSIPSGTSAENRTAFLGAVRLYCKKL